MVRFKITNRRSIEITTLLKLNPSPYRLSLNERSILKRWLAQRYNRPEFPDAFNVRLGKDKCGLQKPFEEKWAAKYSKSLTGVYFGLDKDEEISDEKELYELKIFLVFDSATTENESRALEARSELIQLFNNRCKRDSQWYLVELLDCVVLSDAEFTIKAANTFKRWRFEHRSVSGEPLDQSA